MGTQGSFGYKIGRKIRLMHVQYDADLLWQTCVREIYVLLKHYGSAELLKEAFLNLKEAKNKPTVDAVEKCKPYSDITATNDSKNDWYHLTKNCQHSFINILDTGYMLNNGRKCGLIFIIDFNTNSVKYYSLDSINFVLKEEVYEKATFEEILEFSDMPLKNMTEILINTKEYYKEFFDKIELINETISNIQNVINKTNELGGDLNIIDKANALLYDAKFERRILENKYEYFINRLNDLNLIKNDE